MTPEEFAGYYKCLSKAKRGDVLSVYVEQNGYRSLEPTAYTHDCIFVHNAHDDGHKLSILAGIEEDHNPHFWEPVAGTRRTYNVPPNIKRCYWLSSNNCLVAKLTRKSV